MPLFKVVVEGRRVETIVDGSRSVLGFIATRWVQADDRDSAQRRGLADVRKEMKARRVVLNSDAAPPELTVEDVSEASELPATQPGFVWYPEGEDDR
jgi:hypothetical protein